MDLVLYATIFIVGMWLGYVISMKLTDNVVGTLRVDRSDPDGPYLFLELSEDIYKVIHKKYITLKVDTKSYISRD